LWKAILSHEVITQVYSTSMLLSDHSNIATRTLYVESTCTTNLILITAINNDSTIIPSKSDTIICTNDVAKT